MPIRQAIVIRGPNGVGKSRVSNIILQRRLSAGHSCGRATLDHGWAFGEFRCTWTNPAKRRYHDLVGRGEALLLVEIGLAEPENADNPTLPLGATRNPREWVQLLATEGRQLTLVRISAPRTIIESRLIDRHTREGHPGPVTAAESRHIDRIQDDCWTPNHGAIAFALRAGLREHIIASDHGDWDRVADDVLARLAHPLP